MKNGVLFQYFEWNMPDDGRLWEQLARDASHLAEIGVTSVWIPPAYKADEQTDEGYATYDLYDFGEFDQKGGVRTKYGTREQLEKAIKTLHDNNVQVILDTVLNHKAGGDNPERFQAILVEGDDRTKEIGEPREIEAFTDFEFPGRGDKYSPFKWHWYHFSGVDYDNITGDKGIFRILGEGKGWSQGVDSENGNYDYLLANDIDMDNPEATGELCSWGKWAMKTFGFDGVRMDAIKHIDHNFTARFLGEIRADAARELYAVSEYWSQYIDSLTGFLETVDGATDLFDVPLHFNFHEASETGSDYDMRHLLDGSLVMADGCHAVTFIDNHDSQPYSSLQSDVQDWFKPLAYALILLMKEGYPVVFYGDYYSICHPENESDGGTDKIREASPHRQIIDLLLEARRKYAYGNQTMLFDHCSTVGLIRHGDAEHPGSGLVMLMSNGDEGSKHVDLGPEHAGECWHEFTGSIPDTITLDEKGCGEFRTRGRNVAVWIKGE